MICNKLFPQYIVLFSCLFLFSFHGNSLNDSFDKFINPTLFQKLDTYNKLVIRTDLDSMLLSKRLDYEQHATILFYGENQPQLKFKTKIKARGKFRRVKCDIPPLKLNFSKSELAALGLHKKFDKFKLVGHCLLNGNANNAVLKEYCIYKMHNYISGYSFQVKSFLVVYQDDKNPERIIKGEGFLLEPNKEMAFRNGGELVDSLGLTSSQITPESYHHLIMFNYMIGNTDWNIEQQKNIKFFRKKGENKFTIIPYDFDNCKLVNPPYKYLYTDNRKIRRDNRYIKEKFLSKEALNHEVDFFQALAKYYLSVCKGCSKLEETEKKAMVQYLKPFFKSLKKKGRMEKLFLDKDKMK